MDFSRLGTEFHIFNSVQLAVGVASDVTEIGHLNLLQTVTRKLKSLEYSLPVSWNSGSDWLEADDLL